MKTFTLDQARTAAASGGVLSANLRPVGSMFSLEFETRNGGAAVLVASVTKKVRRFGNPAKAFEIVRDLGLEGGRFSVAEWQPGDRAIERASRPDRAAVLKHAHEAAAYDKWFRGQVEDGIKEADDPSTVWATHAEVKEDMAKQRKALQAQIAANPK